MPQDGLVGRGLLGEDRMIDAPNGRSLRAMVAGAGEDLVLLEAGIGPSGLYWGPVHAALAKSVRVVAYERAGIGGSTPATGESRDLSHLAADLAAIVAAFPHRRLVLVGHSWGGPIIRTFAASHLAAGGSITGLVLVDQSEEHAAALYTSGFGRLAARVQSALLVPFARLGVLGRMVRTQDTGLPTEIVRATVDASSTVASARAIAQEYRAVPDSVLALQSAPPVLGDTAVRVLSGQKYGRSDRKPRALLTQAHRQTAAQHPAAQYVEAQESGHMIPVTEPELIAEHALALL